MQTTYLLIHPERYPSNDDSALGTHLPEGTELAAFDDWYAQQLSTSADACGRRVALLDGFGQEDVAAEGELVPGIPAADWELVACEPHEVGRVVRGLFLAAQGGVVVGGFARHDCVARAVQALERLGLEVTLDEAVVLPLSPIGAQAYLAR